MSDVERSLLDAAFTPAEVRNASPQIKLWFAEQALKDVLRMVAPDITGIFRQAGQQAIWNLVIAALAKLDAGVPESHSAEQNAYDLKVARDGKSAPSY